MRYRSSPITSLGLLLSVVMLAVLLPAGVVAASDGPSRNYIVSLDVAGGNAMISPSTRDGRQRIRARSARIGDVTRRLASQHGFKAGHRFRRAVAGFSARLTPQQAARVARDAKVASVRPARIFRPAAQSVPRGVQRVKAAPSGSRPDVDADIAVLDTGIGPVGGNELNIAGGINCADDPGSPGYDPDDWSDSISNRHGTHVAGTAAARDNGIGTVGVAPGARVWAVRVFDGAYGDEATIVCGLLWAISTHDGPAAPPGTQPIEVINMSLQGPRDAIVEACPGAAGDIMHEAICAAVDVGITVVVAAGNNGSNAKWTSPAGYDQVITVGALSDFDGTGWGQSSSDCQGYRNEVDDAYARYSNYGPDVDIVAPGTCVVSTNTGNGSGTRTLTGTSMSTPHVAGAVARYLAKNPGTSPAQMRKIVTAAGRLDWDPKTDKRWSGVGDADPPNRVLDVAAMLGSNDVRVWLYHDRFRVGGRGVNRSTRVDVQREGGYSGAVGLDTSGLPGAVGSATFDDATMNGLSELGTRLRLALKKNGPDGHYEVAVEASGQGGNPSGSRTLDLTVDRTGPDVDMLGARPRAGGAPLLKKKAAEAYVQWDATDALSSVKTLKLQRKIGSGHWKLVGTTSSSSLRVKLKPGQRNRFRVNATDSLGNKSTSAPISVQMVIRDSASGQWTRPASGGWVKKPASKALGGSLLVANKPAESLSTTFDGKGFAILAPVGPGRGVLRVRVDGGSWREVSLKAGKAAQKRVVFGRRVAAGRHQLEIEGFKGQTALDAILIIR